MLDPFLPIQHEGPGPGFVSIAGSAAAIRIAAFSIADADRAWKQTIRNLEPLHQNVPPLPQTRSLGAFDLRPIDRQFAGLPHLTVIVL